MEITIERQSAELRTMAPTRYGLTTPSNTDLGQKVGVQMVFAVRSFDDDFQVSVAFPCVKAWRSQGRGRKPSRVSSGVLRRRVESHGAWPWAGILAMMFDP